MENPNILIASFEFEHSLNENFTKEEIAVIEKSTVKNLMRNMKKFCSPERFEYIEQELWEVLWIECINIRDIKKTNKIPKKSIKKTEEGYRVQVAHLVAYFDKKGWLICSQNYYSMNSIFNKTFIRDLNRLFPPQNS